MNQPYDPWRPVAPDNEPEWVVVDPGDPAYVSHVPAPYQAPAYAGFQQGSGPAGQPQATPPRTARLSSTAKVVGGAIGGTAALVALIVTLVLVFRPAGRGIEETVTAFMDAAIANDSASARAVACDVLQGELSGDSGIPLDATYVILDTTETGESGAASVSLSTTDATVVLEFTLEKNSDGDFEVCDFRLQG